MSGDDEVAGRRRKGRKEAQAETRERVLAAAAACFARQGFAGSSVDEITAEAGFSRGAFYSNFRSKDEVLLLLFDRHMAEEMAFTEERAGDLKAIQDLWTMIAERQAAQSADWCLLVAEFQLYARRHADRAAPLQRTYERRYAQLAGVLEDLAARTGVALAMPARRIVEAVIGGFQGLMMQRLVEGVAAKGLERDAMNLMIAGVTAVAGTGRPDREFR